ncbi:MAG: helix-turn-helix transcriptional regulator [Novosphingobium sp.]
MDLGTQSQFAKPMGCGLLTQRQSQVLELVAKRRTLKQIAGELQISESAVNQHIKALKVILGVNSLSELADLHRTMGNLHAESDCRNSACRISELPSEHDIDQQSELDDQGSEITFHDAFSYRLDAPWEGEIEPKVVPGLLEGSNAGLLRAALIVAIALGFFALILIGLGVAQGVSEVIAG